MFIKNNSKNINKNDLFICTHDSFSDKHDYINDAIKRKASAVIIDKDLYGLSVPAIKVGNTNDTYYQIYNDFYKKPLSNIVLIGITGTDGKTTVAEMVYQLLNCFYDTAYIGTNGFKYKNKVIKTKNTTPDLCELFNYFNICKENNIKFIVMEASSEGLLHNRCHNIEFNRSIFTNITLDHLNVHKSFKNYLDSKLKLFRQTKGISILNRDDRYFNKFRKVCRKYITYGLNKNSSYHFYDIKRIDNFTNFKLKYKNKIYEIKSPYLGIFNVYNLVSVIALLNTLNIDIYKIIPLINEMKPIDGRMNLVKFEKFDVVIDYAHTIKATYEILNLFYQRKRGRIITIVGCAGGRDKSKRSTIGQLVCAYSDYVYFTMDDPRYENPFDIYNDMVVDIKSNNYCYIKNRKKAIKKALDEALDNDIVLILGKGKDDYMLVKNKYKKYSDYNVVKSYQKSKKYGK